MTGTSVRIDADLAGRESLKGSERAYSQETGFQRRCQVCSRHTLVTHPQPLQRQGERLSPSPAQPRCKITADHGGGREGNKFLHFLMQVRNEQGSASTKSLLSTKRQGSLRSFQAFKPSITPRALRGADACRHPILQHCPLRAEGHRGSGAAQHSPVPPTGRKSGAAQLAKLRGPPQHQ